MVTALYSVLALAVLFWFRNRNSFFGSFSSKGKAFSLISSHAFISAIFCESSRVNRIENRVDVARSRAGEKKKAPNQSRRESSALASSLADCCCLLRPPPKELAFFSDTCCGRRQGTRLSSIDHSKLHWTNCQSGLCQNRSARPPLATFSIEESFSRNNYC